MKKLATLHAFKQDPFGFIIDTLITIVVNLVIPIPLAGNIVSSLRGPALGCLIGMVLLALFMLITIGTIIMSPFLISSGFLQQITTGLVVPSNIAADDGFIETSVPSQNPLGGSGMAYTTITAYFHDPAYFLQFGRIHNGIDLVPTNEYFQKSKTYKEVHQVVAFSTINGKARSYVDEFGSQTVEVTNDENTLKTVFMHFSQILVNDGQIKAGTPLGVMGKTGLATGEHVHYEIRVNNGGNWTPVNSLSYIQ